MSGTGSVRREQAIAYVITTRMGAVPHVAFPSGKHFERPRKLFIDDFIFKDSFYASGHSMPIEKFVNSPYGACLAFRGRPKTLVSKRGNYRLSKEEYQRCIEAMSAKAYADFETGKLLYNGKEIVEPASLDDFFTRVKEGDRLFGTEFINEISESQRLLCFTGSSLEIRNIAESGDDYLKHLLEIRERNALTCLIERNYESFYDFITEFNKGGIELQ